MDWPAYYHRCLDMLHKNRYYLGDDSANRVKGHQEVAEDLVDPVANHIRASKITTLNICGKYFICGYIYLINQLLKGWIVGIWIEFNFEIGM